MQIAVYGKGGIGKSTISANISAALAKKGKKVLQIGCDPKHDSTKLLLHGWQMVTALDYIKEVSPDKYNPSDIIHVGAFGVHCIEAGGPEPGVGCAGRGILTTFDLLERLGVKSENYDGVIYDVLGDVVCGGFAVPLRRDYADKVLIVTSGEYMSIYAANNILRGLENYSSDGDRAAGVIFNSRGLKEEEERVRRFCDAVGLPLLERFPRSDLFADSERKGKCLVECFPDSELAGTFERLATWMVSNTTLYPAKPLSDEELEEKVLNTSNGKSSCITWTPSGKVERPGLSEGVEGTLSSNGIEEKNPSEEIEGDMQPQTVGKVMTAERMSASKPTVKKMMYSKSLISREPLHGCAFGGVMSICTQVLDAVTVAHGPNSCAHITYQAVTAVSRRFLLERGLVLAAKIAPPVVSTGMNESVMIFGGEEELREKLIQVKEDSPKLIFVLTTCPSGIIGEDVGFVKEYEDDDTKIIPIIADGNLAGDYLQGILMTYMEMANVLIDKSCQPERHLVNIIGEKSEARTTTESYRYIERLLESLGVRVNCRFICETTSEEIKGFKKASLNLLAYDDYISRTLKDFLEEEFDAEFLGQPFPVGFNESCGWLRLVGHRFGRVEKAEEIIKEYEQIYQEKIREMTPHLKGKRLMVVTYNHYIDWMLQTATDLQMELSFVGIMNYLGDNVFRSEYRDEIRELVYPYTSENRGKDLKRVKPDILLTNYFDAELEGDYFTDTIPLCPTVGFLSGILIMERWSEFFKMNLDEGWRKDADIYREYSS